MKHYKMHYEISETSIADLQVPIKYHDIVKKEINDWVKRVISADLDINQNLTENNYKTTKATNIKTDSIIITVIRTEMNCKIEKL